MMKLGLHIRLSLVIAILSLLTASFFSWRFYEQYYQREETQSIQTLEQIAETVYNTATIAAYANNQVIAEDVIEGLMKNSLVLGVQINTNTFTLYKGNKPADNATPIVKELVSPFDQHDKIGELILHPRYYMIHEQAGKVATDVVIQTSLIIFATGAFIMLFIWIYVGRPITDLAHSLNHVDPANNVKRLHVPKMVQNTELDLFALTVNELLDRVHDQIAEERKLREQMGLIAKNFEMMLELSGNAVIITDLGYQLKYFNPSFEALVYAVDSDGSVVEGNNWLKHLVTDPKDLTSRIEEQMLHSNANKSIDIKINTTDNAPKKWMSISAIQAINTFDEPIIIIFFNDITRQHEALHASEKAASFDHLTNLKNRRSAEHEIGILFQESFQSQTTFAFIVIDLDGFKQVKDTYGHEAGDQGLIAVAERLSILSRKTDMIARWGGDEFVVALNQIGSTEALQSVRRYLSAICEPVSIDDDITVSVGASIGIVMCPDQATSFDDAFEKADLAMYQVKQHGKRGYQFFVSDHSKKEELA